MTKKFWFKQKKYGYGATPITWEGWLVTAGFIVVVFWQAIKVEKNPFQFVINIIGLIIILTFIIKIKTKDKLKKR
ncbi:hypothetical protein CMO90_01090 [Candidatus Woesearchaeota archaeon]|nr:hypothetical protein [Candidatus Woesearchaeota archaeon]